MPPGNVRALGWLSLWMLEIRLALTVKRHKVHCVYLCPVPPAFGQLPLIQQLTDATDHR